MAAKKKAKKPARKPGVRPAARGTATPELIGEVLELVAAGASLRKASEMRGIALSTALLAIDRHGLADQYARAREARADVLAEESLEIVDNPTGDVQRDRLRLDARKWFASKLFPRKYGDKVAIGGDGDAPAIRSNTTIDAAGLTAAQLRALASIKLPTDESA